MGDAAVRLGIPVDEVKFTSPRLPQWQRFLESVPERDEPVGHMIRLIERDLLHHAAEVLPIDGRDVMSALGLSPGTEVGRALHRACELFRAGIQDRNVILERLSGELHSNET